MKRREPTGPGQESVWDYPRPPRLEATDKRIVVEFAGKKIAETTRAFRVLETSHPPVYYIPLGDIDRSVLALSSGSSFCEFKGRASYYDVETDGRTAKQAAWYYPEPTGTFEPIRDYVAFYPGRMDRCLVDGEVVRPQAGGFYGGWITSDITGPFKGEPGTMFW